MIEVHTLEPGGQTALEMARRVAAFLDEARLSLDLALYDLRLPDEPGDIVAGALRAAAARGVAVRIAYNADHDERVFPPPPRTKPELLQALRFPTVGIPGIPDLMHHKQEVACSSQAPPILAGPLPKPNLSRRSTEPIASSLRCGSVVEAFCTQGGCCARNSASLSVPASRPSALPAGAHSGGPICPFERRSSGAGISPGGLNRCYWLIGHGGARLLLVRRCSVRLDCRVHAKGAAGSRGRRSASRVSSCMEGSSQVRLFGPLLLARSSAPITD